MPAHLHDQGELDVMNAYFGGRTLDVGLYLDGGTGGDGLTDAATYASITTEPAGASYAVQSVTGPTVSQTTGTTEVDFGALSFDVSDSTVSVDACYVRDQTSGDLIFTCLLDATYDLSAIDTLDLSNVSMTLD